jgi:hypothetical protein
VVGSFELSNVSEDTIKEREYSEQLSDCQLLKDSVP